MAGGEKTSNCVTWANWLVDLGCAATANIAGFHKRCRDIGASSSDSRDDRVVTANEHHADESSQEHNLN